MEGVRKEGIHLGTFHVTGKVLIMSIFDEELQQLKEKILKMGSIVEVSP